MAVRRTEDNHCERCGAVCEVQNPDPKRRRPDLCGDCADKALRARLQAPRNADDAERQLGVELEGNGWATLLGVEDADYGREGGQAMKLIALIADGLFQVVFEPENDAEEQALKMLKPEG